MQAFFPTASWAGQKGEGRGQRTFLNFPKPLPCGVSTPFSPDVQTAESGKEKPRCEGQGDGQEHRQELVENVLADFKESMAADPDFIKGVCGGRFGDHILEAHLQMRRQDGGNPSLPPTYLPTLGTRN